MRTRLVAKRLAPNGRAQPAEVAPFCRQAPTSGAAVRRLHAEAQAYRRLYRLERVCKAQMLAMASGRPLALLADELVARVYRVLDRQMPGYADCGRTRFIASAAAHPSDSRSCSRP